MKQQTGQIVDAFTNLAHQQHRGRGRGRAQHVRRGRDKASQCRKCRELGGMMTNDERQAPPHITTQVENVRMYPLSPFHRAADIPDARMRTPRKCEPLHPSARLTPMHPCPVRNRTTARPPIAHPRLERSHPAEHEQRAAG